MRERLVTLELIGVGGYGAVGRGMSQPTRRNLPPRFVMMKKV